MALRHTLEHLGVQVLGEHDCALGLAAGAHPSLLARKRHECRMAAVVTVQTGSAVAEQTAIQVGVKG